MTLVPARFLISLGAAAGLSACSSGLPERAAGVERPISFDGNDYTVFYALQEVTEEIPAPGGGVTSVRFDATILDVAHSNGAPMGSETLDEAEAVADAFCIANNVPVAPVPGPSEYLSATGIWRFENHCGSVFG